MTERKHIPRATERRSGPRRQLPPSPRKPASENRHCAVNLDLPDAAVEFGKAMEDYKNRTGRRYPGSAEALDVLRNIGYRRPGSGGRNIQAVHFSRLVQDYKSQRKAPFLLWSEMLGIALEMGYRQHPSST